MRRKRKVWYYVGAEGMWWCGKKSGWIADKDLKELDNLLYASCSRRMFSAKKAFAHMKTLPSGSVLTRWYYKKGVRYCQDFVRI